MKIAVVTGGSGGIGKATAEKLIAAGYTVFSQYHTHKDCAAGSVPVLGDFSTADGVNKFADKILSKTSRIDLLVNNAGSSLQKLFTDCTDAETEKLVFTDLTAAILLTKRLTPAMVKQKKGVIINVSSIWGIYGGSCEVVYSAAKGGLIAFTKALAKELGLSGIRVNGIAPGLIDTAMNNNLTEEAKQSFADATALGRIGKAKEVAELIAFLAGDKASYVTGQTIAIDGGM